MVRASRAGPNSPRLSAPAGRPARRSRRRERVPDGPAVRRSSQREHPLPCARTRRRVTSALDAVQSCPVAAHRCGGGPPRRRHSCPHPPALGRRDLGADADVSRPDPVAEDSLALAGLNSASLQGCLALVPRAGARLLALGRDPEAQWVSSGGPRHAHRSSGRLRSRALCRPRPAAASQPDPLSRHTRPSRPASRRGGELRADAASVSGTAALPIRRELDGLATEAPPIGPRQAHAAAEALGDHRSTDGWAPPDASHFPLDA